MITTLIFRCPKWLEWLKLAACEVVVIGNIKKVLTKVCLGQQSYNISNIEVHTVVLFYCLFYV